jgi:hypothetical protein
MKLGMLPVLFLWCSSLFAVDFEKEVRPLLNEHCVECHGEKKQKGELRLDLKIHALKGGNTGPITTPGNAEASPLYQRITSADPDEKMPPKGNRLTEANIQRIREWIAEGAVWTENEKDKSAAIDKRLTHWSVQPVAQTFPLEADIDFFINESLAKNALQSSPEADPRTLIRRLSFDLTGLPPTPDRVEQFIHDKRSDAYQRLVEEYLQSPHYGERWARHWLDIATMRTRTDSNGTNCVRTHGATATMSLMRLTPTNLTTSF